MKGVNVIYIDRLSFYSLISLILSGKKYSRIIYFNISSTVKKLLKIFLLFKVVKVMPEFVEFCLADILDEKGESQFIRIIEETKIICMKIGQKEFVNSFIIKNMGKHFDIDKLLIYFEKAVSVEIEEPIVFINIAVWHARNKISEKDTSIMFFMENSLWFKYLAQYAGRFNIRLIKYRTMINSYYWKNYLLKLRRKIFPMVKSKFFNSFNKTKNKKIETKEKIPLISTWYTGKTVTSDRKKRSEFFYLLYSEIPYNRILVHFERDDIPVTKEMVAVMKKNNLKFVALSDKVKRTCDVPVWNPGSKARIERNKLVKHLIRHYFREITKLKLMPLFYLLNMYRFIQRYSFWYDFFSSNGIKININPNNFSRFNIPMNLALEKNGGISMSYQWSDLSFSSIGLSSCSDVLFSFGPAYKWIWENCNSVIDNLLYCGYITDYSFREVRSDSLELRKQLLDKGVKFIICYFDENSSDHRMSVITNKRTTDIYRYFLERIVSDETLGIIFKPKYARSIYQIIAPIKDLIERGKATGRCIFMDKGSYVSESYPTVAAQASDLCIGLLLSGTTVLESHLSGVPAVFLDLEKLYSNPVYQWGRRKVVFDNLDELFSIIQKFRKDPGSVPGFGDVSSWVRDRDPFRDGKAAMRMGQYINWLLEKFNEKRTKEDAIQYANRRYTETWGKERIVVRKLVMSKIN